MASVLTKIRPCEDGVMWLQAKECQRLSANHSRRDEGGFSQRTAGTGALPEPVFEIPNLQNFGKTAYAGLSHLACGALLQAPRHGPVVLSSPVFPGPPGPRCALPRKLTPTVEANSADFQLGVTGGAQACLLRLGYVFT